ncbi:MAG TPA: transketolase [Verrucomicrobia bacterium]|nr:MAG: transketolase [Lentisphaerae bacterium GWF2_57_35]HBA82963.1 transketolase [Verrucomicrobiota bacterium]
MDINLVANTIRGLAMDGVQKANSGHPGMPMGTADFASILFLKFLKHHPIVPAWADRDRYVQSAGHGSMLMYSLLHLSGYDLSLDELKNFRQWGSRTPGHPEYGLTPGVETTTGPLGQGCGNAVGMALAEAMLAAKFNRPGFKLVDHYTYVLAGDGDLMEGVSHEAFSMAGHLGLHKLVVFYDANRITIEGSTDLSYSDDVRKRFQGYRWRVLEIDGHDPVAIEYALRKAQSQKKQPTLIIGHTHIAKGAPHAQDTSESHGSPLGADEIKAAKQALGLPDNVDFNVPESVRECFAARRGEMEKTFDAWQDLFAKYAAAFPELADEWKRSMDGNLPENLEALLPSFDPSKKMATRKASGETLKALAKAIPQLIGGSADLAPSNNTFLKDFASVGPDSYAGRNLHFGIREHAMGSILNGLALHGGWIAYGGTFLVFADYFKPAIRLAALMDLPVVYVLTHDSIFLGEDGPTHQPIEHLASLRCIPNVTVLRPADAAETALAWVLALQNRKGPTALVLTRQDLPVFDRTAYAPVSSMKKGAYVLWQSGEGAPELILMASGSEVSVVLEAGQTLAAAGTKVRVVNMPSWELFEKQPAAYREEVLPATCACRLAVEAASPFGWERYVGLQGRIHAIDRFGASAPAKVLAEKFGFTAAGIAGIAQQMLTK